ncbi:hypothetical protein [Clostridium beijerinckii]|uniref:hypothetical protein n=1 Tax=Clostridium beijerinckii TaxID=1520 RepID=UPI00156E1575|nr:hypothetical protein [Clostridium beijerinckii]NRU52681.1 hypothetical protein [Clostridium beijerinckii]NYC68724.1 hypothetical protein [Clostridium beijerinckii]NYC91873.1 hypothetical protein [Clostridium beijerinckii]
MVIYLENLSNGNMQTLNNVISVAEKDKLVEIITTNEAFKIDTNKVKFTLTVSTNSREKLMDELNIKMDELLKLQAQNKITNGLQDIETLKEFVRKYIGVSEKDKKELIEQMDLLAFEVFMKKKLSKE